MNAPAAQAPPEEPVGSVDEVERRVPAPLADCGIAHQHLESGDQDRILARIHETKVHWASGILVARLNGWKSQKKT